MGGSDEQKVCQNDILILCYVRMAMRSRDSVLTSQREKDILFT